MYFSVCENGTVSVYDLSTSQCHLSLSVSNSDGGIWRLQQAKCCGGFNEPGLPNYITVYIHPSPYMSAIIIIAIVSRHCFY